jgi:hypothetical protein
MDTIQKELIKIGRKDLAQDYYKRIAKLNREDNWISDKKEKEKLIDEEMKRLGLSDLTSKLLDTLGAAIPWFMDASDKNLNEFWSMNHSYWNEDVKVGRKGSGEIYLVDWQGNSVLLSLKSKKV